MTATTTTDDSTGAAGDLAPDPQIDATRAAEIAADATEPTGEGKDSGETGSNREAAKYRRQLRAVESERDGLQAKVEALQRAEVERLAAEHGLTRPSAIWASHVTLDDLVTDDGTVSPDRVQDAVGKAVDVLGLAVKRAPRPDPSQGPRGTEGSAQSWDSFLKSSSR